MKWTQYTYKNGELAYGPTPRTADDMVRILAQLHFLRQAGEDLTVGQDVDKNYDTVAYSVTRNLKDRTLQYQFVKEEES